MAESFCPNDDRRKVSAHEAQQMGMIYKVFANDDFERSSKELASQIAAMPTKGLIYTKYALNESIHHGLEAQLETELKFQILASQTHDFKEGVSAFIEKENLNLLVNNFQCSFEWT